MKTAIIAALASLALLAGCGGGYATPTPPSASQRLHRLVRVEIRGARQALARGDVVRANYWARQGEETAAELEALTRGKVNR